MTEGNLLKRILLLLVILTTLALPGLAWAPNEGGGGGGGYPPHYCRPVLDGVVSYNPYEHMLMRCAYGTQVSAGYTTADYGNIWGCGTPNSACWRWWSP